MLRQDPSWIQKVGNVARDEARANVPAGLGGSREIEPEKAIIAVTGEDATSVYVDVGYDKDHPGFYLWWWEVGTRYHAASPHLRPAIRPGLLGN